jgi:hypothetical protein
MLIVACEKLPRINEPCHVESEILSEEGPNSCPFCGVEATAIELVWMTDYSLEIELWQLIGNFRPDFSSESVFVFWSSILPQRKNWWREVEEFGGQRVLIQSVARLKAVIQYLRRFCRRNLRDLGTVNVISSLIVADPIQRDIVDLSMWGSTYCCGFLSKSPKLMDFSQKCTVWGFLAILLHKDHPTCWMESWMASPLELLISILHNLLNITQAFSSGKFGSAGSRPRLTSTFEIIDSG